MAWGPVDDVARRFALTPAYVAAKAARSSGDTAVPVCPGRERFIRSIWNVFFISNYERKLLGGKAKMLERVVITSRRLRAPEFDNGYSKMAAPKIEYGYSKMAAPKLEYGYSKEARLPTNG